MLTDSAIVVLGWRFTGKGHWSILMIAKKTFLKCTSFVVLLNTIKSCNKAQTDGHKNLIFINTRLLQKGHNKVQSTDVYW